MLQDNHLSQTSLPQVKTHLSLSNVVTQVTQNYLKALGDYATHDLYQQILEEVERPLLEVVLEHTAGNQTKAAAYLGLNRGTLRKKLKHYALN